MRGKDFLEVHSLSAIDHVLRVNPKKIQRICFAGPFDRVSPRHKDLAEVARTQKVSVEFGHSPGKYTEGVTAHLNGFEYKELKPFITEIKDKARSIVLVLDHIQDINNFGALARSAEAFGIDGIVIPKDRSVSVNGGVYNASVGAVESIPIVQVANVAEALKRLKQNDYWIVGSALNENTKPLQETPTFEKIALVLGSELEGLSGNVQENCDWTVKIPMTGKIDSLNVSAAGAVLMYFFSSRA